eukprot:NODE_36_length_31474_cov_0.342438.p3 type:complete len:541 gc:universal NODE_36_length_31474_cov_0.342438:27561-25939(-)
MLAISRPNDSQFHLKITRLHGFDRPDVTVVDSRNFNDDIVAKVNQDANECDYCVMKSDYSTMGTPGKLHAPKLDDKYNTLKYISTYGCIWSWSVSFWSKTEKGYICSNYYFRIYPGERVTLNAKNREYLQKTGMDFNIHALYGLRYIPGQYQVNHQGIQFLFSSVLCKLSNNNVNIYCFNGITEIACLYNALYLELPDNLYRWCKDLNYFNIVDIKPFYTKVLNVTQGNHLPKLFGLQVQLGIRNPFKHVRVSCKSYDFSFNKDLSSLYAIKLPYNMTKFELNQNKSDFPLFNPLQHYYINHPPKEFDYFNRDMALKLIPFSMGQSSSIDVSSIYKFQKSLQADANLAFPDISPCFNNQEIEMLDLSADFSSSYSNITENNRYSIYDTPSYEKGFQVGFLVASLLKIHPEHLVELKHKKLQLLSKDSVSSVLDLEAQNVNESNYGKYHLLNVTLPENESNDVAKLRAEHKDRRKDIGVKQFTAIESRLESGRSIRGRRLLRGRAERFTRGRGHARRSGRYIRHAGRLGRGMYRKKCSIPY